MSLWSPILHHCCGKLSQDNLRRQVLSRSYSLSGSAGQSKQQMGKRASRLQGCHALVRLDSSVP